jgi:hypothetical protein
MTRTSPATLRRLLTLGLLVPAAIGFSAAEARADGESITMVQNDPAAVVDHATNFTASGTLNPDDTMFGFDIFVFMKDADADPTCAADFDTESAAASHSGGNETWVSPPGGFQVGMGPSFSQPFKITFFGPGHYLLCGYVQGDFSTFAAGELRGTVTGATSGGGTTPTPTPTPTPGPVGGDSTPPVAVPAVVHRPWITRRAHTLTCHPGTWSNGSVVRRYRWYAKGHGKKIAAGRTLRVRHALRGHRVLCAVTASNTAGSRTASSAAVRAR